MRRYLWHTSVWSPRKSSRDALCLTQESLRKATSGTGTLRALRLCDQVAEQPRERQSGHQAWHRGGGLVACGELCRGSLVLPTPGTGVGRGPPCGPGAVPWWSSVVLLVAQEGWTGCGQGSLPGRLALRAHGWWKGPPVDSPCPGEQAPAACRRLMPAPEGAGGDFPTFTLGTVRAPGGTTQRRGPQAWPWSLGPALVPVPVGVVKQTRRPPGAS